MSTDGVNDLNGVQSEKKISMKSSIGPKKELCATCEGLDLSIDKFVIYDGNKPFKKSSNASFPGDHRDGFLLKSGSHTYKLGTFGGIQAKNETCPLCKLVLKSIVKPAPSPKTKAGVPHHIPATQLNANCYVNWELDGRYNDPSSGRRARTRRLHLQWESKAFEDSYLVFVAPERLHDINSDSQGSWERDAFFLGRKLNTNGNNQVLMKSWLDQCQRHHGEGCSASQTREFIDMASQSYFGVIDVLDMCLKSLPYIVKPSTQSKDSSDNYLNSLTIYDTVIYEPYVALSYGGLETHLGKIPPVIEDAMSLVRRLGHRYLWVDSLCIVQDSKRSWNLNSRMMNLIYGNAFLTICAADGNDAWDGLKALNSTAHSTSQYIEECVPGVRLMVSQLAETGINASVWNTRAWTFQERLLSHRCLIFTEGRVFFQCRSATMSEDLVSEPHGASWSLDLAKALPQILHELNRRPIRVYMNCMSRYSERRLTQPKDILAAFNGVSNLISGVMRARFIFGLPSSHFDLALLWEPLRAVTRRVPKNEEEKTAYQDLAFPSWSWCGWKGGPIEYKSSQLEGTLTNVHEWLKEHTWIAWYIRDGRGDLRPVWDGSKAGACDSVEERWKGYEAVAPDSDLKDLQTKALENLGGPNAEDFIKWTKEQEATRRENDFIKEAEQIRRRQAYLRYDDNEDRGNYHRVRPGRHGRPHPPSPPVYGMHYAPPERNRRNMELELRKIENGIYGDDEVDSLVRDKQVVPYRDGEPPLDRDDDQEKPRTFRDEYGRNISFDLARKIRSGFQQCLPDNPFRVYIESYTAEPDKDFLDQPLLQFWTWWAPLRLTRRTTQAENISGLSKYDIADDVGDWCGSIILDNNWVWEEEKKGHKVDGRKYDFLAISDAKAFTKEECDTWTYYVPKERENSEWDLYYVLLVEQKNRIWSRVGLGKVFKAAFENAVMPKRWREIILG